MVLPARIAAIGASTVQGRVDPEGGGFIGRFRKWHESQARPNAVFNLGIGGDTVAGMAARIVTEAAPRKPDLIVVSTGINDTRREGAPDAPPLTGLDEYRDALLSLIARGRSLAPLVFVGPFPIDETRTAPLAGTNYFYLNSDASAYVAVQKKTCEGLNIPYLDVCAEWHAREMQNYLYSDGLHCSAAGHQALCDILIKFVESLGHG